MERAVELRPSTKVALLFVAVEAFAWAYVWIARPEYDGRDFGALIFWILLSHIFLIAGGVMLLFNLLQ